MKKCNSFLGLAYYGRMAEILIQKAASPDEFTQLTAITWINEFVAIPPCVSDKEEKIRVVFYWELDKHFWRLKDGGSTWAPRTIPSAEDEDFNYRFNSTSFNGKESWIIGKPAILLNTPDAGDTWKRIPLSSQLPGDMMYVAGFRRRFQFSIAESVSMLLQCKCHAKFQLLLPKQELRTFFQHFCKTI